LQKTNKQTKTKQKRVRGKLALSLDKLSKVENAPNLMLQNIAKQTAIKFYTLTTNTTLAFFLKLFSCSQKETKCPIHFSTNSS